VFLKQRPTETIATISDKMSVNNVEAARIDASTLRVDRESHSIRVDTIEVPLTDNGIDALTAQLNFPKAFLNRLPDDLKYSWMNELLGRQSADVVVRYDDAGLRSIKSPDSKDIDPRRILDIASRVISPEAVVTGWSFDSSSFGFDAVAPDRTDRGNAGDPAVGDITKIGLRFDQDLRHNLAPTVLGFSYRLVCTNGMEHRDSGRKVDARSHTVDSMLAELEIAAELAFTQAEREMVHFYELRNERVTNPERMMNRMAMEHNVNDRMRLHLIETVPSVVGADGTASMFDLINLITNQANDPTITREGQRRGFQQLGGAILSVNSERCNSCSSKLN